MQMPFGMYKGRDVRAVPRDYLLWLHKGGKVKFGWLKDYLQSQFGPSVPVEEPEDSPTESVVQRWAMTMSMKYHPDRGGDTKQMQAINDAIETLRKLIREDQA